MPSPAAVLTIQVEANTAAAQAQLTKLEGELKAAGATAMTTGAKMNAAGKTAGASWTAAGKKMQTVGKSMTKYITLPAVAVGAAAVKLALDFDKSMTLIQTQAGASRKEVAKLHDEVLAFAASGKTQFSPNELAQALYSIESAGIHGAKAMDTLRASSQLATIGQADLASTTKALAAATKTGIDGSGNLKKAIGTLNATVGAGQMKMDDLVSAMGTGFLSSAAALGLNLQDVGASLAELTKQGVPAAAAATRLRMTFTSMATIATRQSASDAIKSIGLGVNELSTTLRQQGLIPSLQLLQDHLDGLSKAKQTNILATVFGGAKSGGTIMSLLNNLKDTNTTLGNIKQNADKAHKSFQAMQKDPEVQLQRAWSQLQAVLIDMGNKLLPKLIPLVKRVADVTSGMLDAFAGAPSWVQDFLIGAIAAGPILRMAGAMSRMVGYAAKLGAAGLAGLFGKGGVGGGIAGALSSRGSTPANPLFVEVINQVPGGGGPIPVGGKKPPPIPGNEIPGWTGWGTTLGLGAVDVGTVALAQYLSGGAALRSLEPSNLFGANKIDPKRANAQLGPRSAQVDASQPLGDITSASSRQSIRDNANLGKSFERVGASARAGISIVDDELAGLRKKYGSLNNAAAHMSDAQKAAYVKSAKAAHASGLISRKELFKVEDAFSSSVGGIHKFTGTTASIKKWSSDTVAAFNKAEGKNKDSTASIKKWSSNTVDEFNKVMKQNKNYADQTDKTKQQVSSDVHKQDQNVSGSYDHMAVVSGKGMDTLKNNTNSALKGLGVGKSIDFSTFTLSGTPGAHQRGGMIGGVGSGDRVPAMLEPGEFVMNRKAVQGIGTTRLEAMNKAIPRFQKGGKVGGMAAMIAEANKFEAHHFPYLWGGGHGGFGIQPVDCSGAVSDVLHAAGLLSAPMTSGSLMNWGKPGRGPLTVYANPSHTVMSLDGRTFGTSGSNPGGGAGWIEGASGSSLAPGAVRTMDVAAAVSKIKRQIIKGPKGALGGAAQMSLDHVWHGANRYLAKHTPGGSFGGGQAAAMGPGKMFTASWYPGGTGGSGHRMDSHSFAEVGWSDQGNGELNGALGGLPYGTAVAMSRAGKSGSFTKWDVGTGGGGIGGTVRAVDFPAAAAQWFWPSYQRDGLTQVKVAVPKQRGGLVPSFGTGGIVPGRPGQPQPVIAHGGERITTPGETRYRITITNWKEGTGHMEEIADGAVDGQRRLNNQLSRMRRH